MGGVGAPTVKFTAKLFGAEKAAIVFGWGFCRHQLGAATAAPGASATRDDYGAYMARPSVSPSSMGTTADATVWRYRPGFSMGIALGSVAGVIDGVILGVAALRNLPKWRERLEWGALRTEPVGIG